MASKKKDSAWDRLPLEERRRIRLERLDKLFWDAIDEYLAKQDARAAQTTPPPTEAARPDKPTH